jgi:CBS domain containing-hemolysin-like protein
VLGKKFDDEEVATIGGYVVTKLGYIPDIGQKIKINDLNIEILDATDKVIKKMKIILVHSL